MNQAIWDLLEIKPKHKNDWIKPSSKAAVLFEDIQILTVDADGTVNQLAHQFVSVRDGIIQYVGEDQAAATAIFDSPPERYPGAQRLMMPTFVNAHTHLPMIFMRNQADDAELHHWLFDVIFPIEDCLTPFDLYVGSLAGMVELITCGSVTFADMYLDPHACFQAALHMGLKANICLIPEEDDLSKTDQDLVKWAQAQNEPHIRFYLLLHAIYTTPKERIQTIVRLAKQYQLGIHVHVSETQKEVSDCHAEHGKSPVAYLEQLGVFDLPCLAAHCVHLSEADRLILKKHHVNVVHNPTSNLKLGSGLADVPRMLDQKITVTLGTDGAASNNRLDMYGEMRLAANLAKGLYLSATAISSCEIFKMLTAHGYDALGFAGGRIQTGLPADLQILNMDDLTLLPPADLCSMVIYSAGKEHIEAVMSDGRYLYKDRQLQCINVQALKKAVREIAERLKSDRR